MNGRIMKRFLILMLLPLSAALSGCGSESGTTSEAEGEPLDYVLPDGSRVTEVEFEAFEQLSDEAKANVMTELNREP